MAMVLQQQLVLNALESRLVGGRCPSSSAWRMRTAPAQWRLKAQQQKLKMESPVPALLTEGDSPGQESSVDCRSSAKVFEDEAHGITCYRTPSGEVTCEGYDEGPYFRPAESGCVRKVTEEKCCGEASVQPEGFAYKYVKGGQGKAWCEGKDES